MRRAPLATRSHRLHQLRAAVERQVGGRHGNHHLGRRHAARWWSPAPWTAARRRAPRRSPGASSDEPLGQEPRAMRVRGHRAWGTRPSPSTTAPRAGSRPPSARVTSASATRWVGEQVEDVGARACASRCRATCRRGPACRGRPAAPAALLLREEGRHVDRQRRLPGPALLVDEGDAFLRLTSFVSTRAGRPSPRPGRAAAPAPRSSRAASRGRAVDGRFIADSAVRRLLSSAPLARQRARDDRLHARHELLVRQQLLRELADALLAGGDELLHHGVVLEHGGAMVISAPRHVNVRTRVLSVLSDKRLLIVTGKGGVGKTTLAAALALHQRARGQEAPWCAR